MSGEFRSRVWEEAELGKQGQVDAWDLGGYRLAAARIRILSDDAALVAALGKFTNSGKRLGAYWRRGKVDFGISPGNSPICFPLAMPPYC